MHFMQLCSAVQIFDFVRRREDTDHHIIMKTSNRIEYLQIYPTKFIRFNLNNATGEAGLLQFRNGVKTVSGADEKFSKLKKDVSSYLR